MRKILLDTNLSSVALNQGKVINPENDRPTEIEKL